MFEGGFEVFDEDGVGFERSGLVFGVGLGGEEKGVLILREFDHFDKKVVWGNTANNKAFFL